MRVFIAVPLYPGIDLESISAELETTTAGLRMVKDRNRHLTLAFLGEVSEAQVRRLHGVLEQSLKGCMSFQYSVMGIGAFPRRSSPKAIWCGVGEPGPWKVLHTRILEALRVVGISFDSSDFHPHITLARNPSGRCTDDLARLFREEGESFFGQGMCKQVQIVKSELGPSGPCYEVIGAVVLEDLA
ncbi:MAG: RNA 2',3'-cyclic phosphodiesterase [Candidatus Methanomethylophilaceae archaeon]|nr:RNA 2',3'-cyclic phosphodiesterase [Candidatus Methanomethylophilaceae archaeon]